MRVLKGLLLFILEVVVAYLINIIVILMGIGIFQHIINIEGKQLSVLVFSWMIFFSILVPISVVLFIGENYGGKSENIKTSLLSALFGACILGAIELLLPADYKFGTLGGVAFVEYLTAPALTAIGYNLGKGIKILAKLNEYRFDIK
jgi:RsiW-degrading membrane proteinase PrsW (M82 family)